MSDLAIPAGKSTSFLVKAGFFKLSVKYHFKIWKANGLAAGGGGFAGLIPVCVFLLVLELEQLEERKHRCANHTSKFREPPQLDQV